MFRTVPLSIIRNFSLYTQQRYMSYSLLAGSGRALILLANCMTYTVVVCTVKNCWWWTEELSETCIGYTSGSPRLVHIVVLVMYTVLPNNTQFNLSTNARYCTLGYTSGSPRLVHIVMLVMYTVLPNNTQFKMNKIWDFDVQVTVRCDKFLQ